MTSSSAPLSAKTDHPVRILGASLGLPQQHSQKEVRNDCAESVKDLSPLRYLISSLLDIGRHQTAPSRPSYSAMASFNPFAFRPWPVFFWTTVTYLAVLIPLLYVHETVPAIPKEKALPAGVNLTDAWVDLQRITAHYHPYNSHANDEVREYLARRSKQILDQNKIPYTVDHSGGRVWSADFRTVDGARTEAADRAPGVTLFDDQISNATFITESTVKGRSSGASSGQYFEGTNFYAYIHGKEDPEGEWWNSEDAAETFRGKGGVLVNCHYDS